MNCSWMRATVLGAALAVIGIGCAEEREPINRVQANALAKSFFVGQDLLNPKDDPEFWTQATLIDVPYGVSQGGLFTSTYTQGVARIKWQITEDLLLGRLTYERVEDSDGKGAGPASLDGQIAVAFRIQSHFDIRRGYNPSTGEELNVIEENQSDRPWYERQYFRVDWSQNLQTDAYSFDTLSMMGVYDGVEYSPLAYYVNDPTDPDAPYFDVESGYFDVTNKAFAVPQLIDLSSLGWGVDKFPACMLPDELFGGTEPKANCDPSELTIRQAFRRVVDTDFEPDSWDGHRFQAYGAFTVDRNGFARNYGMSDAKWYRFISRYNIWQRSHYYQDPDNMHGHVACYTPETTPFGTDPKRDLEGNGTADECEDVTVRLAVAAGTCPAGALTNAQAWEDCRGPNNPTYGGSQCDTFKQRCTLPYRFRKVRPLSWYFSSGSNQEYFDGTDWATHDWDVALRHSVQVAAYSECRATGETKDNCAQKHPVYFGQMDDHLEAIQLAQDVDACRRGIGSRTTTCDAFAEELLAARGRVAGDGGYEGLLDLAKREEMIVLCHSPVQAGDHPSCASADQRLPANMTADQCAEADKNRDERTRSICRRAVNARRGDLRYHLVNVLWEPQTPSPWGIYTDAEDPLTGETFSAAINVWTYVNDLWSQMVIDRIRYIKDELTTGDVTEAGYVYNYAKATEAAQQGGLLGTVNRDTFARRLAGFSGTDIETARMIDQKKFTPSNPALIKELKNRAKGMRAAIDAPSTMAPIYQARRNRVRGTEIEAQLMDPMMQQLTGTNKLPLTEEVMNIASPLRGNNPSMLRQLRHFKEIALAEHGTCVMNMAPAPMAVTGLADALEEKFSGTCVSRQDLDELCKTKVIAADDAACSPNYQPDANSCVKYGVFNGTDAPGWQIVRAERMRKYLAQSAQHAVIVHEMGHSIGQRHNFVSSGDPFNYRPQYWQLRTKDGNLSNECTQVSDGENCVGPRWFDPVTKNEADNLIWMWMQSSVMDYAGEYSQDMLGLATWDFAAARMYYGNNVAVYADEEYHVSQPRGQGALAKMDNFGGILGLKFQIGGGGKGCAGTSPCDIHYTRLQDAYELIKQCRPVNPEAFKPVTWDESKYGKWHPIVDGLIVKGDGVNYTKCKQQQVDYVNWNNLIEPTKIDVYYRSEGAGVGTDKDGRVRVPYGFATDRWADLGNASVYRHDNGADVYEIFDFLLTQQEVHHIFDNYRRGRRDFSVRSAANRTLSRYNEKVRDGAKGLALISNIYRELAYEVGYNFDTGLWAYIVAGNAPDNMIASGMSFDHFVRSFARPEVGGHFYDNNKILRSVEDSYKNASSVVDIPNGPFGLTNSSADTRPFGNMGMGGKLVENRLCENCGEYDSEFTMNAGSYYDKVNAAYLMTESVDNFISDSRGDYVDARYRATSLADLFPEGYRRWLSNNLTGDDYLKGPRMAANAAGTIYTEEIKVAGQWLNYPTRPLGWVTWWTEQPEVCFPSEFTQVCSVNGGSFPGNLTDTTRVIDPQVGWEQQKFLINWTMLYLPENQKQNWINQLRLWELGADIDPGFGNRIEFHDPNGRIYVAKTFGKETLFGKTVEKGVAARVLEYANSLVKDAYEVTEVKLGTGNCDSTTATCWYKPDLSLTGQAVVKWDSSRSTCTLSTGAITNCAPTAPLCTGGPGQGTCDVGQLCLPDGHNNGTTTRCHCTDDSGCGAVTGAVCKPTGYNGQGQCVVGCCDPGCDQAGDVLCTCAGNTACLQLEKYVSIPMYLRQVMAAYGLSDPEKEGVWE